jgi:hypothetical protein
MKKGSNTIGFRNLVWSFSFACLILASCCAMVLSLACSFLSFSLSFFFDEMASSESSYSKSFIPLLLVDDEEEEEEEEDSSDTNDFESEFTFCPITSSSATYYM